MKPRTVDEYIRGVCSKGYYQCYRARGHLGECHDLQRSMARASEFEARDYPKMANMIRERIGRTSRRNSARMFKPEPEKRPAFGIEQSLCRIDPESRPQ